jgi:N-acyl-D-amino-acid deacylase
VFKIVEDVRRQGLHVTADVYPYPASSTGLDATMPPWVQEGGHRAWVERLKNPETRRKVAHEMRFPSPGWDAGLKSAGSADNILLVGFRNDALRHLTGKTLAEVAAMRNRTPEETAMDLVIEDDSRVGAVFFSMSEDNVRKKIQQPWVSFCSDSASLAPEGVFLKRNPHPRAYGSFARLLGRYVREEKLVPLEEAVRRLTSFPAENLRLDRRGRLTPGHFADIVVFDPKTITDHATYDKPHQYATGVRHVFVNGVQVLENGEQTRAKPGRVVRGPGARQHRGKTE